MEAVISVYRIDGTGKLASFRSLTDYNITILRVRKLLIIEREYLTDISDEVNTEKNVGEVIMQEMNLN